MIKTDPYLTIKVVIGYLLANSLLAQAQEAEMGSSISQPAIVGNQTNRNAMTEGVGGLLINSMLSPNGNQFFQMFGMEWQDRPESENISLNMVEATSKSRGNQVFIYAGRKLLFVGNLPFKSSQLKLVVDQALEAISTASIADVFQSNDIDKDLAADEL